MYTCSPTPHLTFVPSSPPTQPPTHTHTQGPLRSLYPISVLSRTRATGHPHYQSSLKIMQVSYFFFPFLSLFLFCCPSFFSLLLSFLSSVLIFQLSYNSFLSFFVFDPHFVYFLFLFSHVFHSSFVTFSFFFIASPTFFILLPIHLIFLSFPLTLTASLYSFFLNLS